MRGLPARVSADTSSSSLASAGYRSANSSAHPIQRLIDTGARLDADDHQVDGVREAVLDLFAPGLDGAAQPQRGDEVCQCRRQEADGKQARAQPGDHQQECGERQYRLDHTEQDAIVRPDDFYDDAHQRIFTHMVALHDGGRQIDLMLLVQRLKDAGEYELIGGAGYLAELGESVPTAAHAEYYAQIVRDKSMLRALIFASTDIVQEAYNPNVDARQMLSRAEEKVFGILDNKGQGKLVTIREVLHESLARIDARMKHEHACGGIETGFDDFDELTGGLHKSELVILAAGRAWVKRPSR